MTQEEIIEMVKQADVWVAGQEPYQSQLEAFAKLVAQHAKAEEREACAKVCEDFDFEFQDDSAGTLQGAAEAIRARGDNK